MEVLVISLTTATIMNEVFKKILQAIFLPLKLNRLNKEEVQNE
jgi:hypothetical protein